MMMRGIIYGVLVLGSLAVNSADGKSGFLKYADYAGAPYTVAYDNRSLIVGGERGYFASVGIHYPRFTPGQWDDIFLKAKNDGYNMIQTYFFHNAHQPKLSTWPWIQEGPSDLRQFLAKAGKAGFFVDLRIGPYVCAEWSWGGYPYDLAQTPGLVSRSSSAAWEEYMTAVVLNVTREYRDLFADKGGPIILGQVENELHTSDQEYVDYCGKLAEKTEVPIAWGMCNGNSADTTINTCNGGSCTKFIENNGQNGRVLIDQPALWTENWMGWFDAWGGSGPAGDWPTFDATSQSSQKSYGILQWTARGGSHVNFYNWAGGNHFGRNAGSSMVNVYYWKAPISSDNLAQGPERMHMVRTYAAIATVSEVILSSAAQLHKQQNVSGFHNVAAFVYKYNGSTVVFLENSGYGRGASITWDGKNYTCPLESITLIHNGNAIFNTADVILTGTNHVWQEVVGPGNGIQPDGWSSWKDSAIAATAADLPPPTQTYSPWHSGSAVGRVVVSPSPMEAVNFTEYDSELCIYATEISATTLLKEVFGSKAQTAPSTTVNLKLASAKAQVWTVFLDGVIVGSASDLSHSGGTAILSAQLDLSDFIARHQTQQQPAGATAPRNGARFQCFCAR